MSHQPKNSPPPSMVLGCNTPHGVSVLSDWIEEQTGQAPDFSSTSWSDDCREIHIAESDHGLGYGFESGGGYGNGDSNNSDDVNGDGYGYGYVNGDGSGGGYGYVNCNGNGNSCGEK